MIYATYDYYFCPFNGTILEAETFDRYALRASAFLDYYTQGRAAKHPDLDALKMACCALAEQYQLMELSQAAAAKAMNYTMSSAGGELSSETVGPHSKTYRSGGESAAAAMTAVQSSRTALADIARQYLAGTGLLYRGGCGRCTPTL